MNSKPSRFWLFQTSKKIQNFFILEPIVNWGIIKKSALMMIIGFGLNLEWFIWKVYLCFRPEYWKWLDVDVLYPQVLANFIILVMFLIGLILCYFFHENHKSKYLIPIFTGILLNISICVESLLIGALSPANTVTYVCLTNIILIIFPRRYVYFFLLPCTLFYITCCYLTLHHQIDYDYLFTIKVMRYTNSFWLTSMIVLISPVLLFAVSFTELLLNQWRTRERLIQQTSQRDPLTNIANRRVIDQTFDTLKEPYSLILVDLDFFKHVNDHYGHYTGDQVLIHVARVLQKTVRLNDIAGRLGGEEFLLILKNQNEDNAKQIAERCRLAIKDLVVTSEEGIRVYLTASFGVSYCSKKSILSPQQVLNLADKALYVAKNSGRDQVQVLSLDELP